MTRIAELRAPEGGAPLTGLLAAAGMPLDLRCGGSGLCGRCRVELLAGEFAWDGRRRRLAAGAPPVPVNACRVTAFGGPCRVRVPLPALAAATGQVADGWTGEPLPVRPETVVAVDLGTTTVAAVKIRGGRVVASAGAFNEQSRYGDNVISRINHAMTGAAAVDGLRRAAVASINRVLAELDGAPPVRIAVAGNTVMSCLLHGIDPSPIGVMPFTPPCRRFPERTAGEMGLAAAPSTPVLTAPAISGYLGGDLTAGLAEVRPEVGEMLVDLGTNCELLWHTEAGFQGAAAAAGPAFEGAGIGGGCRAVPGAIDHWDADGVFSVLGGGAPQGICGSGMIDFLAAARRAGRLNEFGRLVPPAPSIELAPGVSLGERDVEQLLKAKAAVIGGIRTLAAQSATPLRRIYLAGGFARYLRLDRAVAIGMLPDCECRAVGNTSLGGAARLAVDPDYLAELERWSDLPRETALNALPDFEDNYIDGLLLP